MVVGRLAAAQQSISGKRRCIGYRFLAPRVETRPALSSPRPGLGPASRPVLHCPQSPAPPPRVPTIAPTLRTSLSASAHDFCPPSLLLQPLPTLFSSFSQTA